MKRYLTLKPLDALFAITILAAICLDALTLATGCGTFNRTTFNTEVAVAQGTKALADQWSTFYTTATNNPALFESTLHLDVTRLPAINDAVHVYVHKIGYSLASIEQLRALAAANATNYSAVQAAELTLLDDFSGSNSLSSLVAQWMPTNWITVLTNLNH